MKYLLILAALTACSCDRQTQRDAAAPSPPPPKATMAPAPASSAASVVPMPKDQAELDRLILAGYTPHGTHLDPPGAKGCPLAQGNKAVM